MRLLNLIMLSILVLAMSCSAGGGTSSYSPYRGTKGLVFEFMDNAPPKFAYEGTDMPIALRIENQGATEISDGVIIISSEKDRFIIDDPEIEVELTGKTLYNREGQKDVKTIFAEARGLDPQQETHTSTISATACYPYETVFTGEVCVDTDYKNLAGSNKACTVRDLSSSGQGAPVVISRVEVEMLPSPDERSVIPRFTVHVTNSGQGRILDKSIVEDFCTADIDERDEPFDVIHIKQAKLSNMYPLRCDSARDQPGTVSLARQGDTFFRCTYEQGIPLDEGAFTTPLIITLEYGYTETISTEIEIRAAR